MDLTILDLREAAEHLHATIHFIRGIIASGELRYVKIGKKFCVTRADLDRWVEANRKLRTDSDEIGESLGRASARRLKSVR
jgi:excisionase family DNA binding protein